LSIKDWHYIAVVDTQMHIQDNQLRIVDSMSIVGHDTPVDTQNMMLSTVDLLYIAESIEQQHIQDMSQMLMD
jgi:hypothetical protein